MSHISVLYQEALDALNIKENGLYIDGTLGAGGHTEGILQCGGRVLAFDWDPEALAFTSEKLASYGDQVQFVNASYAEMGHIAPQYGFEKVDGILMDLGLSSRQLDNPERGFSFRYEAPLDMRFNQHRGQTAADLLNDLPEATLADIFWRYGDERQSRKIARAIVAKRPLQTTKQLASLIEGQVNSRRNRIHPATKIFQALRIAVNGELDALEAGVKAAVDLLKPSGRIAVISFHSLEDRFVKNYFRDLSKEPSWSVALPLDKTTWVQQLNLVTRKPLTPTEGEIEQNPRSRSAKLRVAEKL
jgi:16S rRNA (cytosine1402-N4)-methyltransferase